MFELRKTVLCRVVYESKFVGDGPVPIQSVAEILGACDRNNRRDHLTGCIVFHEGRIVQAIEGARHDLDRLIRRLRVDVRHTDMRIIVDMPIAERQFSMPMDMCGDPGAMLRRIGLSSLNRLTASDVEAMLEQRLAA